MLAHATVERARQTCGRSPCPTTAWMQQCFVRLIARRSEALLGVLAQLQEMSQCRDGCVFDDACQSVVGKGDASESFDRGQGT
jgi:hypothetical protein